VTGTTYGLNTFRVSSSGSLKKSLVLNLFLRKPRVEKESSLLELLVDETVVAFDPFLSEFFRLRLNKLPTRDVRLLSMKILSSSRDDRNFFGPPTVLFKAFQHIAKTLSTIFSILILYVGFTSHF